MTDVWNVVIVTWAGVGSAPVVYRCELGGTTTNVTSTSTAGSGSLYDDSAAQLRLATRDPLDATFYGGGMGRLCPLEPRTQQYRTRRPRTWQSPEFMPSGLVMSSRITGTASPEINAAGGTNGTVTGTTFLTHPAVVYPGGITAKRAQYARRETIMRLLRQNTSVDVPSDHFWTTQTAKQPKPA